MLRVVLVACGVLLLASTATSAPRAAAPPPARALPLPAMPELPPGTCTPLHQQGDGTGAGMLLDTGKMGKKDTGRSDGQMTMPPPCPIDATPVG
jgi:hypothetical protein